MSCCSSGASRHIGQLTDGRVAVGPSGAAGNRVHFPAARTFVGTNSPVIQLDGEGLRRETEVSAFLMEDAPVTNDRFSEFVAVSGYVTEAQRFGSSAVFRGLLDGGLVPRDDLQVPEPLWLNLAGACWSAPEGNGSNLKGRGDHPVVHVTLQDAGAFARWCGGRLPTEAEWEHAARGGLSDPRYPWGDDEPDDETIYANIWQGAFPHHNTLKDGYLGTCPVSAFPANGAGLFGMSGNVWEWTSDRFRVRSRDLSAMTRNARAIAMGEMVLKGGSFLCHRSYCYRYRIAARSALTAESSASNAGFRVVYDA